ncbi:SHOCT domain-containing protein [Natronolimnohabitans sp. A-GB9]|uniref:SHOCT domain-containing protein n=1 Tax=Natronolimnohabitans sp. A-GB9 TaxID=3069757 RepID=UPI0027B0F28A|nr:SHOCT domain-containing protein [Natronolimnohabitans sp. A-GB9]MDQ2051040.1 SHOCT domain-containing protein [Natronolimnohabitans sp. A-GB9]
MARLGPLLLKGAGALLLVMIVLGVVATIAGVLLSIVATAVAAVVTLTVFAVLVLAVFGLVSLLGSNDGAGDSGEYTTDITTSADATDRADRLQSRYVDGELSEAEFERELERLLEDDSAGRADVLDSNLDLEGDRSREPTSDRSRLWDR